MPRQHGNEFYIVVPVGNLPVIGVNFAERKRDAGGKKYDHDNRQQKDTDGRFEQER